MAKLTFSLALILYSTALVSADESEPPQTQTDQSSPNQYPKEKPTDVVVEIVRVVGDCTKTAKVGDLLSVHYNGTFSNGSTADNDSR